MLIPSYNRLCIAHSTQCSKFTTFSSIIRGRGGEWSVVLVYITCPGVSGVRVTCHRWLATWQCSLSHPPAPSARCSTALQRKKKTVLFSIQAHFLVWIKDTLDKNCNALFLVIILYVTFQEFHNNYLE